LYNPSVGGVTKFTYKIFGGYRYCLIVRKIL